MWCVLWVIVFVDYDRIGFFVLIEKVIFWFCVFFILICVLGKDCNNGEYVIGVLENLMFVCVYDNEFGFINVSFY